MPGHVRGWPTLSPLYESRDALAELEAPETPERNPTGLYRTSFGWSSSTEARLPVLHLGGAESVALVWCNGEFVGMGKDSRLPSEFDLSSCVRPGNNCLAVMVIRYSDATWIEDQDHWWHAGLHRSVFLDTRGPVHITDIDLRPDYDPKAKSASIWLQVFVPVPGSSYCVRVGVETAKGN